VQTDPDYLSYPSDETGMAEVITRYLDGGLTEEELTQFNARLLADASARTLFVRIVRLHGMLTERALAAGNPLLGEEVVTDSDRHDPAGESLDDAIIQPAIHEEEVAETQEPVSAVGPAPWDPHRQEAASQRKGPGIHPVIISGLAALLVLGCSLGIWAWQRSRNPVNVPVAISHPAPAPAAVPAPVVRLGDAIDARFEAPNDALTPGQPIPAGALTLKSGWIRVDFPTGVCAVVEAPARFEVQSLTKMGLTSGRISAQVPPPGHGFTIAAPLCDVVDLGTEFGISVDSEGKNDIQVFKGVVSLNRPFGAGQSAGTQVLSQGDARQIESMTEPTVAIVHELRSFLRLDQFNHWRETISLGDKASITDRWRTYSERLSRDPSLALYYTFDDRDSSPSELKNHAVSTLGQYDVPLASPAPTWVDGRLPGTAALDFNPDQKQRLLLPSYPTTSNGQLSCSAWVFARSRPAWASIAKSWGNSRCGAFHLGLLGDSGDLDIELDGTAPNGPRVSEGADHPFPIGRWVHVAFTSDGKILRLYRDGKEVASVPSRPIAVNQPITTLSIGVKTDDDGVTPSIPPQCGFWDGKIGQFALFHRALTADEIARMNEFGPP
jgi:hypothetical protein